MLQANASRIQSHRFAGFLPQKSLISKMRPFSISLLRSGLVRGADIRADIAA